MTTDLAIDSFPLDRVLAASGVGTGDAAVAMALQEFIARREQRCAVELFGKLELDDSYDHKAERSLRA